MISGLEEKLLKCKNCGESIMLPLENLHRSCVCSSCHAYYTLSSTHVERLEGLPAFKGKIIFEPNTEIVFRGVKYLVLGCVERCVSGYNYYWREYHIWSKETGLVFLSEYNGAWTYLKKSKERPRYLRQYRNVLYHFDQIFEMFSNDQTEIHSAAGAFLMKVDAKVRYMEYISPPNLISTEISSDGKWWFIGEYVDISEIEGILPQGKTLPVRFGVPVLKPNPVKWKKIQMLGIFAAFAGLVFLLTLLFGGGSSKSLGSFAFKIPGPQKQSAKDSLYVSRSFTVDRMTNLTINYTSGLDNSWMYVDGSLINEVTGEEYYFGHDMEHYSGIDQGYSWSEGDNTTDQILSSVPAGKYRIQFKIQQSVSGKESVLTLGVVQNQTIFSNIFVFIFLGGLVIGIMYLRYRSFEFRRWENSDYSPYNYEG